jgi:hypothetical protein
LAADSPGFSLLATSRQRHSVAEAITGIRRAARRREYAERLHHDASDELRARSKAAQAEGVPIAQIAREALSRQGVYDLLAAARPS